MGEKGKEKEFSKTEYNLCLQNPQISLGTIKLQCIMIQLMLYCLVCTECIEGKAWEKSKWTQYKINGKHKAFETKTTFHCLLLFSFFLFYVEVVYSLYFQVSIFICEAAGAICSGWFNLFITIYSKDT